MQFWAGFVPAEDPLFICTYLLNFNSTRSLLSSLSVPMKLNATTKRQLRFDLIEHTKPAPTRGLARQAPFGPGRAFSFMHWGIHSLEKPHKSSRVLPRKYAFGLRVSRSRLGFTQAGKQLRTAEAAAAVSSGAMRRRRHSSNIPYVTLGFIIESKCKQVEYYDQMIIRHNLA